MNELAELPNILPSIEENKRIPIALGLTAFGNTKSFGGLTLKENALKVDEVFEKTSKIQKIWNHPMSQWQWKHSNLSYHSEWKNIRQIAAELASKKAALDEAKWKYIENEINLQEKLEKLETLELNRYDRLRLQLEIAKLQEGMKQSITYLEGAMKDVLTISDLYDFYAEKYKNFTEEDFENAEAKSHLQRSLVQCLRDVREHGTITKGEQEYLEQIGVNPSKVQQSLTEYLVIEGAETTNWDVGVLHKFIEEFSEFLLPHANKKMILMGFSQNANKSITFD